MTNRSSTVAAILGGVGVVLAVGLGAAGAPGAGGPLSAATSPSSSAVPTPGNGGALPVEPVGGGGCIIGMNCGCIPHRTCPSPHPRPGNAGTNQHDAAAPQNP